MITLLKVCCLKSQVNMVKTLKICKDIKTKYAKLKSQSTDLLIPQRYKDVLR